MWIVWLIGISIIIYLYLQIKRKQKLIGLVELYKVQAAKNPVMDEINIGYIYGMARSLSNNIMTSKKNFFALASLIFGTSHANQAMLTLLSYSTQPENKKQLFVKAANRAMEDVINMSALLSNYDPLSKNTKAQMPDGLSKLLKEQKKK